MPTPVKPIDSENPDPAVIQEAAQTVQGGGVVVFPTSGLYGLAADARNAAAVQRVFRIKRRSPDKPLSVLVGDTHGVHALSEAIPPAATLLMDRFWPGSLTLVVPAGKHLPENLTAKTGKIGVRLPLHPVALSLVQAVGGPVTATSANLSGAAGLSVIAEIDPQVAAEVDLILDGGKLKGGAGSTVVDTCTDPPVVLREGAIPAGDIFSTLGI